MRIGAVLGGLALAFLATSAQAADMYPPMQPAPAYNPAAFQFEGFYLGAQGAGILGGSLGSSSVGVVAGVNFSVDDPILAGVEFQGDWLMGSSASSTFDFFALGRGGVVVMPAFLAYGEVGTGWAAGNPSYLLGGGGEYALTDSLSVKGEVQGIGAWGSGFGAAKVQAGLLFHFQ
ncbi:MAG TPA: hypothetical protein VHB23_03665 [Devosiaceae bacterium]|jgi:outer membrane immunogenic protein|nr:hypothetical protein [Devosiaceae bacterium]